MLKIHIKTTLITLDVEDEHTWSNDNYTMRNLPPLLDCIKEAVDNAIKLHNETKHDNL